MKRWLILVGLVASTALCTAAAAPPPKPTSVIAGLGQQVGTDGRYYSTVAPFSVQSVWTGATYKDANGQRDRLSRGDRHVDILTFANNRNFNTDTLNQAAQAALHQSGFSPRVSQVLLVDRQHVPVLVFSDTSGSYAESVFILLRRAWIFALSTDRAHVAGDLKDFLHIVRSFRLEHHG
ncbi:MAG: hypothetical protein NVSMB65_14900 [Chloroflexota bacterium]